MFETGLAVFLGISLLFIKLRRRTLLWLLGHDLVVDLAVTLITLFLHWGSFSGVMAATVAGLLTSIATSTAKRVFGHVRGNHYVPGLVRLDV